MIQYKNLLALIILWFGPALPALGDSITLRASVRMPDQGDAIRLGDVAQLQGQAAEALADKVIADIQDPSEVHTLSIREVRKALDAYAVNWGTVNLSGREVVIRPRRPGNAAPPQAMTRVRVPRQSNGAGASSNEDTREQPPARIADSMFDEPTLRGAIVRLATRRARVTPSDLRLAFVDVDRAILDATQNQYRFDIQPTTGSNSDRYGFQVRLWSGGEVRQTHLVSVTPFIRTQTVRAVREIDRHDVITESDIEIVEHWLAPTHRIVLATREQVVGRVAESRIKAGERLRRKDVKRRTLIERGDRVMVRCLVGGFVVSVQAEARHDGAEGDRVEFRKLGERETFLAQVTGPHEAVLRIDQHDNQR